RFLDSLVQLNIKILKVSDKEVLKSILTILFNFNLLIFVTFFLRLFTNDLNARGQCRQSTNISILVKRVKLFSHQLIVQ
ncbi:unnamed protein product, partial [Larinioides sclopetarius]